MKKLFFPALLIGAFLALIHRLFAKPAAALPVATDASYDAIDAYVAEQMHHLNIPGACLAIVEGDRMVHLRGFGRARPGGETPGPQTPFFIGSLTKSFTALAVMQLVEAGKVELDAPVQRYLPWFRVVDPQASARLTVRHLLNQTSGLPAWRGLNDLGNMDIRPDAAERQVRAFSDLKLSHPVGSKFEYTNSNYNVLGLIVEAASGETYADYIQNHVFNPLQMRRSYASKAAARGNGLAVGHRYWFGQPVADPDLVIPSSSLASGQLICSAEDMAHYLIANLNGGRYGEAQILSEAGLAEMHRGAAEWKEMGYLVGHYGMGWISEGSGETRIVSHSGIVPDFGAFMALVPEQRKGIVLLLNANHAMMKLTFDELGMNTARLLAGESRLPMRLGFAIWLMRAMLLIPLIQVAGVVATLGRLRGWRSDPETHPSRGLMWRQHILLPLIPNLLTALTLVPVLGRMGGFIRLFMPDFTWVALVCGSFAGIWAFLRTGLILRTLRKPRP